MIKNNTGEENSGEYNSGNRNSGDYNSGNYNSGNYNSGNRNSGNYNSGNRNSGMFNTNEPKMRIFNKECDLAYTEFRSKFGYKDIALPVCSWIEVENMTEDEKKNVEGWSEMGGYLKTLEYKEAWKKAWSEASKEVKDWYQSLPNFDWSIFTEITGIEKEKKEMSVGDVIEVCANGKKFKAKICEV